MQTLTAEVEIDFPQGKKTIEMKMKTRWELEDCEKGTVIMLNSRNGSYITGLFRFCDDENVVLDDIGGGKWSLDVSIDSIEGFWEEIK